MEPLEMDESTQAEIEDLVKSSAIVLFMKGNDMFPMCGFSGKAVAILKSYGVVFKTVNVLAEPRIREGVKEYANWPTIPQLFVRGEFVGGCDIIAELHEAGALAKVLMVDHRQTA